MRKETINRIKRGNYALNQHAGTMKKKDKYLPDILEDMEETMAERNKLADPEELERAWKEKLEQIKEELKSSCVICGAAVGELCDIKYHSFIRRFINEEIDNSNDVD